MGTIVDNFGSVYRDYETDGVPGSGEHEPVKSEIRGLGAIIEATIGTVGLGSVSTSKTTRALLLADLAWPAESTALVYADATDAYNDLWLKSGASGAGTWTNTNALHGVVGGLATSQVAAQVAAQVDPKIAAAAASVVTATAQAVIATNQAAIATAAAANVATVRAERLKRAVIAAAGGSARVNLLLTKDGAKTYRAGSATDIDTIAPLLPETGVVFGQGTNGWNGTGSPAVPTLPLRPVETATGLSFHRETGFHCKDGGGTLISPMPSLGAQWYFAAVLRMPALAATYADVTAMNADLANRKVGEVVYTGGGTEPTFAGTNAETGAPYAPIPADTTGNSDLSSLNASMTRGYYIRSNTVFARYFNMRIFEWWDSTGAGNIRMSYIQIDPIGRLQYFAYDGTVQEAALNNWGPASDMVVYGQTAPLLFELERDDDEIIVYLNGVEVATFHSFAIYTPNRFQINGFGDGSIATTPYSGQAFTLDALVITNGLDYKKNLAVANVIAAEFGTPARQWCPNAYAGIFTDQSRLSGTFDARTTPAIPDAKSNWSFQLAGQDGGQFTTSDAKLSQPSGDLIPGAFGVESLGNPHRIGPLRRMTSSAGATSASSRGLGIAVSAPILESIEWGFAAELMKEEQMRNAHLYIVGACNGGFADEALKAEDAGQYLYTLADPSSTVTQPRTLLNRAIMRIARRCLKRGQTLRPLCLFNVQGETFTFITANKTQEGMLRSLDLRNWFTTQVSHMLDWTGQPPIVGAKVIEYSATDGLGNDYNKYDPVNNGFGKDNQMMQIENDSDATMRYVVLGSTGNWMGRGIHWPAVKVREFGMIIGDRVRRGYFENAKIGALKIVSAAIGAGGNAGKIVLTTNRRITVDNGGTPMMPGVYHTDGIGGVGFLTYGLIFESHATATLTFNGVPADGDTTTINGVVYTYKATPTAARHVKIGTTAADTANNMMQTLLLTGTTGTTYGTGTTLNNDVFATLSGAILRLYAVVTGAGGNAITLAKAGANLAVSGANLAGGDARTISGDVTYTNNTNSATILVPISGTGPQIGDVIANTGAGVLYSNFREETARVGAYNTQMFAALPLPATAPTRNYTAPSNLSDYLAPGRLPL